MKGKLLFIKNAAVLTAASLILKTAGMVLRVWLSSHLLSEGLGLYQLIVSVYLLASKPLTAGLETAVTKIGSEGIRRADKVARAALFLSVPAAIFIGSALFFAADYIAANLLCDIRAALSLKILCFSLPFMAMSAVLKGYFISRRNSLPHSSTQLIEQAVRMAAVVLLVSRWQENGIQMLCAAVLLADVIAEAASFLAVYIWGKIDMHKLKGEPIGQRGTSFALGKIALPVAGERAITAAFHTAENLLVPTVAAAAMGGRDAALSLFGVLKGMALPLVFFPSSFLAVFSTLLIPEMAESLALGHRLKLKRTVSSTFGIIITISVFLAAAFFFFAEPLGMLIYKSREAAYMIRVLAPIVPFMYCESIADGMMKGMGRQVRSFWAGVIDAAARLGLVFLLCPQKGIDGFLLIMILSNTLAAVYKMGQVLKVAGLKADLWNWAFKPTTAALISGSTASLLCGGLSSKNNILFLCVAGLMTCIVYFALMGIWGGLPKGIIPRPRSAS